VKYFNQLSFGIFVAALLVTSAHAQQAPADSDQMPQSQTTSSNPASGGTVQQSEIDEQQREQQQQEQNSQTGGH